MVIISENMRRTYIEHRGLPPEKVITILDWVDERRFATMGVTVGSGAVVAARAVIVKDVAPWTVMGGNAAKFIKRRVPPDGSKPQ